MEFEETKNYRCIPFLEELNKCKTGIELIKYIDSIVDSFVYDENTPRKIGTSGMLSKNAYKNEGQYNGFIDSSIEVSNSSLGYNYRIYDRDYLYQFAIGVRQAKLPTDSDLLPWIMNFLDSYFGFPRDNIDRREDIMYEFAVNHAESFYKEHNIPIKKEMGADYQMLFGGDVPLSVFRNKNCALCSERAALAQNIMQVCGYNSSIVYGDCESNEREEGHCWNSVCDDDGNVLIVDFSNVVYSYQNGKIQKREPYFSLIEKDDYEKSNGLLELPDYHYENGEKVLDGKVRKYLIGRSFDATIKDEINNRQRYL